MIIQNLENAESKIFKDSLKKHGKVLENADNMISLCFDFMIRFEPDGWIFSLFLAQIANSLSLSLISKLKRHEVQAQMMLRQALESTCLACFSLYNTNKETYLINDENNLPIPISRATDKAYSWLEKNYPNLSNKIKFHKNIINKFFSHANLFNVPRNIDFSSYPFNIDLFDKEDELMEETFIWYVGNITYFIIELLLEVTNDYPIIEVNRYIPEKHKIFGIENEKLRQTYMKNTGLSKYKDYK